MSMQQFLDSLINIAFGVYMTGQIQIVISYDQSPEMT